MRGVSEVHGADLIKKLASEKIKRPELRDRVWSDSLNAWGFFADPADENDKFLIMGCCQPGDMFIAKKGSPQLFNMPNYRLMDENPDGPYVILGLKCFSLMGTQVFGLEMLAANPPIICQMLSQQSSLFKIAWKAI